MEPRPKLHCVRLSLVMTTMIIGAVASVCRLQLHKNDAELQVDVFRDARPRRDRSSGVRRRRRALRRPQDRHVRMAGHETEYVIAVDSGAYTQDFISWGYK